MGILKIMGAWRRTRLSKCQAFLMVLFALSITQVGAQSDYYDVRCPRECKCRIIFDIENGPVLRIQCLEGGLHRIPVKDMDWNVFKLQIDAPKDRPNYLTIGPIFTQPDPFQELRDVQIINSNVPSIGKHAFWGLQYLKILNLTHNKISSIEQDNFRGLINLAVMDLSYNHIDNMASETFRHCPNLKRLYLTHNNITILNPRLFRMLVKLHTLDLSGNPIADLSPEVFKDIQQLKALKCRNCCLSRVNAQVYNLASELEEIDLGYNLIKYVLIDDFQDLKKLMKISLDGNQISVIVDYVFAKNIELRELNIANNKLAFLSPNSLTNLTRLHRLDIGLNKIERLPLQTLAPPVNSLRTLIFNGNNVPLNEIAVVLQTLPNLENIGLANLSLTEIPPNIFDYNRNLVSLDISWNNITEFPLKVLLKTKFLHYLDISHNHLTKLEDADLHRLEAIPNIRMSHNTWNCYQCSTGKMLVYMRTTVLNESLRDLRCHEPLKLRGIPLWNVSFDLLEKCPASHEAQMSVVAGLVLVLVAVLAAVTGTLCCAHRRAQRYYTHEEKRPERDPENPEELLPHTDLGAIDTTNATFCDIDNNS